jgi:hypothetical protein
MKFKVHQNGFCEEVTAIELSVIKGEVVSARFNNSGVSIRKDDLKNTWKYLKEEFFGGKKGSIGVVLKSGGVFWPIFVDMIFPWFLDIAKVWCCIKICQAFLQERNGSAGSDGRTGLQALVHYGKWFLIFECIPFLVELIDQIGHKMVDQLSHQQITIPTSGNGPRISY